MLELRKISKKDKKKRKEQEKVIKTLEESMEMNAFVKVGTIKKSVEVFSRFIVLMDFGHIDDNLKMAVGYLKEIKKYEKFDWALKA